MTTNTIRYIAPNGARVIVTDWSSKVPVGAPSHNHWHTELLMQIIFNDPLLTELEN